MREYEMKITETLEKTVTVRAKSREEAHNIVNEMWNNEEYVLDAGDFKHMDKLLRQLNNRHSYRLYTHIAVSKNLAILAYYCNFFPCTMRIFLGNYYPIFNWRSNRGNCRARANYTSINGMTANIVEKRFEHKITFTQKHKTELGQASRLLIEVG